METTQGANEGAQPGDDSRASHRTRVGVVRETNADERRVALVPKIIPSLVKQGVQVVVEAGAGVGALIPDEAYEAAGATIGDPWRAMHDEHASIAPLLEWWERDLENGEGELPFPPDYPKMPGEPPRVQPSKKVAEHWDEDGNRIPD